MLVKYYLNNNIKASFEDFILDLWNAWAGLAFDICLFNFLLITLWDLTTYKLEKTHDLSRGMHMERCLQKLT